MRQTKAVHFLRRSLNIHALMQPVWLRMARMHAHHAGGEVRVSHVRTALIAGKWSVPARGPLDACTLD